MENVGGAIQLALIGADYSSESDLLAACRRREIAAFERLYQVHGPRLKSIACHLTGNRSDAEDAVQETFLKVYRSIDGFHGTSSLSTWLCRICINTCHDLTRRRRTETDSTETLPVEPSTPRGQTVFRLQLEQALRRIHPGQRTVFLLFEVEGLRHAEIASILEIPEGTSKAWLFEAKKELRRLLTEIRR